MLFRICRVIKCPIALVLEAVFVRLRLLVIPIRFIDLMADPTKEVAPIAPSPVLVSLSHSQPVQRVTSVLLNGKNFHTWSRCFRLYLGGKRPTGFLGRNLS